MLTQKYDTFALWKQLQQPLMFSGPFTIFAPSNLAFARLGSTTLNALKTDTNMLTNILKYHVVSGIVTPEDLMVNEKMLDTLSGQQVRVNYYMYNHVSIQHRSRNNYKTMKVCNQFQLNRSILTIIMESKDSISIECRWSACNATAMFDLLKGHIHHCNKM